MDFKPQGYYTRTKSGGILITEKAGRQKGKEMLYRPAFAQIMNRCMEQRSFDRNIDREQSFECKNETREMDMRHIE